MSTVAISTPPQALSIPAPLRSGKQWLFGPWFDIFLIANIAWPVVALLALLGNPLVDAPLTFIQIYFLSTPHRWITLALVFLDRERFQQQPRRFILLGVGLVLLGLALVAVGMIWPRTTSSLVPLMMLDYIWNAWHFASQHAGIARIYSRTAGVQQSASEVDFERTAVRVLVLWLFFRLAMFRGQNQPDFAAWSLPGVLPWLDWIDPIVLIGPLVVFARELSRKPLAPGRLTYLGSVIALYFSQLVAIRMQQTALMAALFLSGAIFHAVEYLSIVSWSVRKKSTGIWRHFVPRLGLTMLVFMLVLTVSNYLLASQSLYAWTLITLLVSLLHYGYDGIIWKSRPAQKKI